MKLVFLLFFFSLTAWGRPIVLLSYFDAFGKASYNNSEKVALLVSEKLRLNPNIDLRLCELSTVFDRSYAQLENCLRSLPSAPQHVVSLGEATCDFKIELMGRNLDHTKGADNAGLERKKSVIIPEGPKALGFSYPLEKMYCALSPKNRAEVVVSNNAGSFVCNNLAYQMAYYYPELTFGFIHVPANNCRNIETKTMIAVENLEVMLTSLVTVRSERTLPVTRKELEEMRTLTKDNQCESEFFKRAKSIDEKGLWPF